MRPIKAGTRVLFAAWRNVFMACDVCNWIGVGQTRAQGAQGFVLAGLKSMAIQSFQFNAYGEIIALVLALEAGHPRMPSPVIATDHLPQLTLSADEKVGRDLQALQVLKVGVLVDRQLVGEQIQHVG